MAGLPVPVLPDACDVYVVQERNNPSTDYYVRPLCEGKGRRVHYKTFLDVPAPGDLRGAVVVFVRYLPPAWLAAVDSARATLASLVFFIDDDLLDPRAWGSTPWRYRWKLFHLSARHIPWLRRNAAELWVSTPWLAEKYAAWQPRCVLPRPLLQTPAVCRVFYHGSASHQREIRWIEDVMEQVLEGSNDITFEIVGGQDVYRRFGGLPRTVVVHPMKWAAYQAFLEMPGRHIGLAPHLDIPFNRGRSCTKFFDITRSGAVGVYADEGPCASFVEHDVNGVLVPMQPGAWVSAIQRLAGDEALRARLASSARRTMAIS